MGDALNVTILIQRIKSLKERETLVYFTGHSGWLDESGACRVPLLNFFADCKKGGLYDFTQKRVGPDVSGYHSVFEYRVTRRTNPIPPMERR